MGDYKMKRIVLLAFVLFLSTAVVPRIAIQVTASLPVHNINTLEDFATIQEAINDPDTLDGHTILVDAGTYYEHLVVDKSISLIGENRTTTIIDGNLRRTGFHVISDDVNVSGFTIRNCGYPQGGPYGGVHLNSSDNCRISGNTINNCYFGIQPDSSSNNTISNNTFSDCYHAIGGAEMSGSNQHIFNNLISNSSFGIYLRDSSKSIIYDNIILNSRTLSINLLYSSNTILANNNMSNNTSGLQVSGWSLSHFFHNIDVSNTVDGKPVYYLINHSDLIIDPSTFPAIGYLGIVNSTNLVIKNLDLTKSGQGLLLAYTTHSTIMHLNTSFNSEGIDMFGSSYNTITDNRITSNRVGINLNYGCKNNTISNNTISETKTAIQMFNSDDNIFRHNDISGNHYGIVSNTCYRNTIYHNKFIKNTEQMLGFSSANVWDNGYPYGGNYWSDYTDVDQYSGQFQNETGSDRIWDHPYVIDENNQDNYPLISHWGPPITYIASPENKTYTANTVSLTFEVSEPTSWIGYSLDGQENITIAENTTLTGLSDGSHSLVVYAMDEDGNTGASETIYFTVAQKTEPFPITWIVATIVLIALVGAALLVYFVKVRKTTGKVEK